MSREQRRGPLFYRGRSWEGLLETQSPLEEIGVPSIVASHWLSCEGLSLAGLLLAKEKTFPPAGIGKYRLLPIGSAIDGVTGCETTPFWPPRPELFLWASLS